MPAAGIPKPSARAILRGNGGSSRGASISSVADLPTRFGPFQVVAFHTPGHEGEHAALIKGDVRRRSDVPVRLHSECLTGDVFGSLRCDCREQLELSLEEIQRRPRGILLYLRQEGRGIGFENKIRAYRLQELGFDTIEANEALGFRPDERDYEVAARMLELLGVRSIVLMSNNPRKIADLQRHGIRVTGRIPIVVRPNRFNRRYLETKRLRAGHLLGPGPSVAPVEQLDCLTCETPSRPGVRSRSATAEGPTRSGGTRGRHRSR
ncbi:MAG: GTP cyclohydrolase II [Thermoplasmata archaeon]